MPSNISAIEAADGGIERARFREDILWPNQVPDDMGYGESERLGLLSLLNVSAKDGWFEAINPSIAARIDSQIDLRGVVSDYTGIADFEAATLTVNDQKQELVGQGSAFAPTAAICAITYIRSNNAYWLVISQEIAGIRAARAISLPGALTGRHRAALTVRVGGSSTILSTYLNGRLVSAQTVSGIPTGFAAAANTCFSINDNRSNYGQNFFGKFYAAALFNEALTANRIAYLSK